MDKKLKLNKKNIYWKLIMKVIKPSDLILKHPQASGTSILDLLFPIANSFCFSIFFLVCLFFFPLFFLSLFNSQKKNPPFL